MLLYICFIVALGIGIILAIVGSEKFHDSVFGAGMIITAVFSCAVIFSTISLIVNHVNQDAKLEAKQAERSALVWQLENDKYDGSSNAIGDFNSDVIQSKAMLESDWLNIFVDQYYSEVEPIDLSKY